MDEVLRATNIKKGFKTAGDTFWALKGVSLTVYKSKLHILKGRSGSGKTTLINILGALDYPTEGDVLFTPSSTKGSNEIKNITKLGEPARDAFRRNELGFIFQSVALVSMMTAFENVEFAMRIAGYGYAERKERTENCLGLVGLGHRMHHLPQELSGGEQQRVAIARAISHKPKVIFADEPTAELDTNTGLAVVKIFKQLVHDEGATIVMTTHDPGLMEIADVVYELEDGELK